MIVDNHSHISQVEVQDVVDEYDKNLKYGMSHRDNFDTVSPALLNVFKKFPDLTVVLIHGIDPPSCLGDDGTVSLPESAVRLISEHDVYMDLLNSWTGRGANPTGTARTTR